MGKTIIQTITDKQVAGDDNGKLSAKQMRGINAAGTQYESGIYLGYGNNCSVVNSETPLSFDINTGMYSAGGLICEITEPETVTWGSGTNGQYALLVATVEMVDESNANVKYEVLKGTTTGYPTYKQQNMTYGDSGITQIPLLGFKYDGLSTASQTTSVCKYFSKNWGETLDDTETRSKNNESDIKTKADKSDLAKYVLKSTGSGTNVASTTLGTYDGNNFAAQAYVNAKGNNTVQLSTSFSNGGQNGIAFDNVDPYHIANGTYKRLAYDADKADKSDLAKYVLKSTGSGTNVASTILGTYDGNNFRANTRIDTNGKRAVELLSDFSNKGLNGLVFTEETPYHVANGTYKPLAYKNEVLPKDNPKISTEQSISLVNISDSTPVQSVIDVQNTGGQNRFIMQSFLKDTTQGSGIGLTAYEGTIRVSSLILKKDAAPIAYYDGGWHYLSTATRSASTISKEVRTLSESNTELSATDLLLTALDNIEQQEIKAEIELNEMMKAEENNENIN